METIHVKFDELTTMASECNNSGAGLNCSNSQDSSEEMNEIPSQKDLDNLSNNSAAKNSCFLEIHSDEQIQEDIAEVDGNTIMHSFKILEFEEDESSSNHQDPSNMHDWIESMQDEINQFKRLDAWELVPLPEGRHAIKMVGPKMAFKPQQEYRPITKKLNASSSGNKKKGVEPTIEVSNSNPFDVLNSVDNDVEFGTYGGTTNLVNNEATSSGSSFMHIDNDGKFASNTPIGEKIDKIERNICECKIRLLVNDGNLLVCTGIVESDSEVEVVFDETANLRIPTSGKDRSDKGYGNNSLLEQWRDSYADNDDYDSYNDDMYENHDLSEHMQSICDDLDIMVCGRKKI
ncbi:hypothetical protein Tco_1002702 [Tanacetum coccineum]|uniref:Uncharacterized protein n=1 Tax=Tanacetum coccineum TaxID=301880 RepID=A0ABQ5F7X5_9ASTR